MKNLYVTLFSAFLLGSTICTGCAEKKTGSSGEVIEMIHKVNGYWQTNHPGNMEVYFLTKKPEYLEYSKEWAEHNQWKGAKSDDKTCWKYSYG